MGKICYGEQMSCVILKKIVQFLIKLVLFSEERPNTKRGFKYQELRLLR